MKTGIYYNPKTLKMVEIKKHLWHKQYYTIITKIVHYCLLENLNKNYSHYKYLGEV